MSRSYARANTINRTSISRQPPVTQNFTRPGFLSNNYEGSSSLSDTKKSVDGQMDLASFRRQLVNVMHAKTPASTFTRAAFLHAGSLGGSECVMMFRYISGLVKLNYQLLERYNQRLLSSDLSEFTPQEIGTVMSCLVKMKHFDKDLFNKFATYFIQLSKSASVPERSLAVICNAFARAGVDNAILFDALASRACDQAHTMTSRSAATICHSIGKLELKSEICLQAVLAFAKRIVENEWVPRNAATSQELANVLYAFGNLKILESIEVIGQLTEIVKHRVNEFKSIEISAVATAMNKLRFADKDLMKIVSKRVQADKENYTPFEVASVLHAFSQLAVPVPRNLFNVVAPIIIEAPDQTPLTPETACIILGAYSRSGMQIPKSINSQLFDAIALESNEQYIANAVYSIAQLGDASDGVRQFLMNLVNKLGNDTVVLNDSANVTQLIYALNKFGGFDDHPLYFLLLETACKNSAQFSGTQIGNIAYSIAHRNSAKSEQETQLVQKLMESPNILQLNHQMHSSLMESFALLRT